MVSSVGDLQTSCACDFWPLVLGVVLQLDDNGPLEGTDRVLYNLQRRDGHLRDANPTFN
jgi:hypothetical protein